MIRLKEIITFLDEFAPPFYKEDWDNIGLQVGQRDKVIEKIYLALTPSSDVIERAILAKANLIITHHPFIFKGIKSITDKDSLGKAIFQLIKNDVGLFSMHTNFDVTFGGVNDILADYLEVTDLEVLEKTYTEKIYKLVVYVPENYLEKVQEALFQNGAGNIGEYSECAFISKGKGSFKPSEKATPFISSGIGQRHYENEIRLECIVPSSKWQEVKEALLATHPYESVAYDLFLEEDKAYDYGIGRVGNLETPMLFNDYITLIKKKLKLDRVKAVGDNRLVRRIAFCGGSGSSLLTQAKKMNADCYVTGDLKYHDGQLAKEIGLNLVDITHFSSEKIAMIELKKLLENKFDDLLIEIDTEEKDFFYFI